MTIADNLMRVEESISGAAARAAFFQESPWV